MLIDMWETILSDIDKGLAASCIVSLDFEKAFNRLDHDACISALKSHGASNISIRIVHAFLNGRTMKARVGNVYSGLKPGKGCSPQGSILGNLLFTTTTDNLTENIDYDQNDLNIVPYP